MKWTYVCGMCSGVTTSRSAICFGKNDKWSHRRTIDNLLSTLSDLSLSLSFVICSGLSRQSLFSGPSVSPLLISTLVPLRLVIAQTEQLLRPLTYEFAYHLWTVRSWHVLHAGKNLFLKYCNRKGKWTVHYNCRKMSENMAKKCVVVFF